MAAVWEEKKKEKRILFIPVNEEIQLFLSALTEKDLTELSLDKYISEKYPCKFM